VFRDEMTVHVQAGRGGDGCVNFHSEPFKVKGGPDGGDGGRGGNVVFVAKEDVTSLIDLVSKRKIKARPGQAGGVGNCWGKYGDDARVEVPVGTMIFDVETEELLVDLTEPDQEWIAVYGGRGGHGNKHYATATHQVPHDFEYGLDGQQRELRIELKLIADVGLVGFPNAGKSTLLSRCSSAKPKIANYPFTTLSPQLGIVERNYRRFIMADIPGLIEGASEGKGLGHQFLRHIERTRLILHMIDLSETDEIPALVDKYQAIRRELERFSDKLGKEPEIIVGNKVDVTEASLILPELEEALGVKVWPISGVSGEGVDDLMREVVSRLDVMDEALKAEQEAAGEKKPWRP